MQVKKHKTEKLMLVQNIVGSLLWLKFDNNLILKWKNKWKKKGSRENGAINIICYIHVSHIPKHELLTKHSDVFCINQIYLIAMWQQHSDAMHITIAKQPMIILIESCRMSLADSPPSGASSDFFPGDSAVRMILPCFHTNLVARISKIALPTTRKSILILVRRRMTKNHHRHVSLMVS
jgi:hypothetical protein